MNHRGGRRALPPAMPAPPLTDDLTIAPSASGAQQGAEWGDAGLGRRRRRCRSGERPLTTAPPVELSTRQPFRPSGGASGRNRKGTAPAVAWSTVPERNRSSCGHQNSQEPVDPEWPISSGSSPLGVRTL